MYSSWDEELGHEAKLVQSDALPNPRVAAYAARFVVVVAQSCCQFFDTYLSILTVSGCGLEP